MLNNLQLGYAVQASPKSQTQKQINAKILWWDCIFWFTLGIKQLSFLFIVKLVAFISVWLEYLWFFDHIYIFLILFTTLIETLRLNFLYQKSSAIGLFSSILLKFKSCQSKKHLKSTCNFVINFGTWYLLDWRKEDYIILWFSINSFLCW